MYFQKNTYILIIVLSSLPNYPIVSNTKFPFEKIVFILYRETSLDPKNLYFHSHLWNILHRQFKIISLDNMISLIPGKCNFAEIHLCAIVYGRRAFIGLRKLKILTVSTIFNLCKCPSSNQKPFYVKGSSPLHRESLALYKGGCPYYGVCECLYALNCV